jgi:hypothetical protein
METPSPHHGLLAAMRQASASAAFGAALLLFFGFFYLAEPTGTDLFSKSVRLMYHTLRIGGIATAAISIWLWMGHRPALIVDAVVAAAVGGLFILTGLGMLADNGAMMQVLINAFCGAMFIRAAAHSAAIYRHSSRQSMGEAPEANPIPSHTPMESTAPRSHRSTPQGMLEDGGADDVEVPQEPPPEGYLASLAKKRNP